MRHRQVLQDIPSSREQVGEGIVEGAREEHPAEAQRKGGQRIQRGREESGGGDARQQRAHRESRDGSRSTSAEGESLVIRGVSENNHEGRPWAGLSDVEKGAGAR